MLPGEAIDAARCMFDAWRGERSDGDGEATQTLEKVAAFVDANGDRFEPQRGGSNIIRNRAGWYSQYDLDEDTRVWMFTTDGLKEATTVLDFKLVVETLNDAGWASRKRQQTNGDKHVHRWPGY
jgi:hypothetical protein